MTAKYKERREKYAHFQNITVSQNFLTSRRLLERIVRKSTITKEDVVVEIGTGKEHLTKVLCERCRYLYSVEIDRKLYEYSRQKLVATENLKLIHGDFLRYLLPKKGQYKVFANIPYNITTEIVMKCVNTSNLPTEMWLVMEKGAAKCFMGIPHQNKKSADLKAQWDLEIVYFFEREDFHPKPSVDSVWFISGIMEFLEVPTGIILRIIQECGNIAVDRICGSSREEYRVKNYTKSLRNGV